MNVTDLAKVCYAANRAYCQTLGDNSQPAWEEAPEWQRTSAINGVSFQLVNPDSRPSRSVPYAELSEAQKAQDALFVGVVNALRYYVLKIESTLAGLKL